MPVVQSVPVSVVETYIHFSNYDCICSCTFLELRSYLLPYVDYNTVRMYIHMHTIDMYVHLKSHNFKFETKQILYTHKGIHSHFQLKFNPNTHTYAILLGNKMMVVVFLHDTSRILIRRIPMYLS